jgi:tyrosyl-DNA phosphodiesterase-1
MDELVDHSNLESAFIASFFIGQDELFKFLPFKNVTARECPIWISRDFWQDADGMTAAEIPAGCERKQYDETLFKKKAAIAKEHYKHEYGPNFNAVYPYMSGGCSHSKILLLRYPDFLRVVITTANLMALDIELGDNVRFTLLRYSPPTPY